MEAGELYETVMLSLSILLLGVFNVKVIDILLISLKGVAL